MWITRCLAEGAEEAATVAKGFASLSFFDLILAGIGFFYLAVGIMTAVTKKFYGGLEKHYNKYTAESVRNCVTMIGIQYVLVGLCMLAFSATLLLNWSWSQRLILVGVFLIAISVPGLGMNKKLVKK